MAHGGPASVLGFIRLELHTANRREPFGSNVDELARAANVERIITRTSRRARRNNALLPAKRTVTAGPLMGEKSAGFTLRRPVENGSAVVTIIR